MKTIQYLKGDATVPQAKGIKIIAHICNDIGGWGKGFVLAVSKRWEEPEKNIETGTVSEVKIILLLGEIQLVQVEKIHFVANIIGQKE